MHVQWCFHLARSFRFISPSTQPPSERWTSIYGAHSICVPFATSKDLKMPSHTASDVLSRLIGALARLISALAQHVMLPWNAYEPLADFAPFFPPPFFLCFLYLNDAT